MDKIKVAKELIKLAKSLVTKQNLDQQTQAILDEAEAQGKKYILHHKEGRLWRIMACKDFGRIKKGDFGGLIESEDNLSHNGNCWVYRYAQVYEDAQVQDNAKVYDYAQVYGNALVSGWARVHDGAQVFEGAIIHGNANVHNGAKVYGTAQIYGRASVYYDVDSKVIRQ